MPVTVRVASFCSFGKTKAMNVQAHNAAAVGIVENPTAQRFTLHARNSDCAVGDCAFYYLAIATLLDQPNGDGGNLQVGTGEVQAMSLNAACVPGDAQTSQVDFHQPFLTPPTVLLTANDLGVAQDGHNAAAVGIAQNVTPYGFTLLARNSDCMGGQAGFYWVAIGCSLGCG
jgi:hypothetical protein